jgi:hypothetical protein
MAAIQSLLNPLPEGDERRQPLLAPISTNHSVETSPQVHARKKQKMSKDAAIFNRGVLRGECRFPPYEKNDKVVATLHQQYELHPKGHIADFPRHIPYSSEKKSFWEKTGRDSFEGQTNFGQKVWPGKADPSQFFNMSSRFLAMTKSTV